VSQLWYSTEFSNVRDFQKYSMAAMTLQRLRQERRELARRLQEVRWPERTIEAARVAGNTRRWVHVSEILWTPLTW